MDLCMWERGRVCISGDPTQNKDVIFDIHTTSKTTYSWNRCQFSTLEPTEFVNRALIIPLFHPTFICMAYNVHLSFRWLKFTRIKSTFSDLTREREKRKWRKRESKKKKKKKRRQRVEKRELRIFRIICRFT